MIMLSALTQIADNVRGCTERPAPFPAPVGRQGPWRGATSLSAPSFGWDCQHKHSWHSDPAVPSKQRHYIQTFSIVEVSTEEEPYQSVPNTLLTPDKTSRASCSPPLSTHSNPCWTPASLNYFIRDGPKPKNTMDAPMSKECVPHITFAPSYVIC